MPPPTVCRACGDRPIAGAILILAAEDPGRTINLCEACLLAVPAWLGLDDAVPEKLPRRPPQNGARKSRPRLQ